jgi:hypothetical protein
MLADERGNASQLRSMSVISKATLRRGLFLCDSFYVVNTTEVGFFHVNGTSLSWELSRLCPETLMKLYVHDNVILFGLLENYKV